MVATRMKGHDSAEASNDWGARPLPRYEPSELSRDRKSPTSFREKVVDCRFHKINKRGAPVSKALHDDTSAHLVMDLRIIISFMAIAVRVTGLSACRAPPDDDCGGACDHIGMLAPSCTSQFLPVSIGRLR